MRIKKVLHYRLYGKRRGGSYRHVPRNMRVPHYYITSSGERGTPSSTLRTIVKT